MPGDGKIGQPAFHMVTDLGRPSAFRAGGRDGDRVAVQVSGVASVGGVVDAETEFGRTADRVGAMFGQAAGVTVGLVMGLVVGRKRFDTFIFVLQDLSASLCPP